MNLPLLKLGAEQHLVGVRDVQHGPRGECDGKACRSETNEGWHRLIYVYMCFRSKDITASLQPKVGTGYAMETFGPRYSAGLQIWTLQPTELVLLRNVPLLLGCGVREFGLEPKIVDLRTEPATFVRYRLNH
jgi:hypothetical protein